MTTSTAISWGRTVPEHAASLSWDGAEAELAKALPNYESRDEQRKLAYSIEHALSSGTHLAAQAGTGTGKSFAALIPGIIAALNSGKSVVIATGTKVLQGQYALKDIPFLVEKLESYFGPVSFAELKGRSNYLCLAKTNENPDVSYLGEMLHELSENPEHSGDLDRFSVEVLGADKPKLSSTTDECPGASSCPFGEECYAVAASGRAKEAQLVITNHAMLATELIITTSAVEGERPAAVLLPDFDHVIVDEAQDFEGYVTNALGARMQVGTFLSLGVMVDRFTGNETGSRPLAGAATRLFDNLGQLVPERGAESTARLTESVLSPQRSVLATLVDETEGMLAAVRSISVPETDKRRTAQKRRLSTRIQSLLAKLSVLDPWEESEQAEDDEATRDPNRIGEVVRWVQREGDKIVVGYSPLSVANFLAHKLWAHHTGVLLSATLANGRDFSYIPRLLGLPDYDTFDAGTPFDYEEQAALWVPDSEDFHPTKAKSTWAGQGHMVTFDLVKAAGGRALLLFTSRSAMNQRWDAISEELEELGFPCYRQEPGTSTDELMRRKEAEPESVVFGLKSLMQGVSANDPNSLRLVMLDKMPFPVPTEVVFQARGEARDKAIAAQRRMPIDKAKWERDGSFFGMSVPEMMLVLLQAFGRLIRTKRHRGLMVVLDSRLSSRSGPGYGKAANRNLPPAMRLRDKREALSYLKGLDS